MTVSALLSCHIWLPRDVVADGAFESAPSATSGALVEVRRAMTRVEGIGRVEITWDWCWPPEEAGPMVRLQSTDPFAARATAAARAWALLWRLSFRLPIQYQSVWRNRSKMHRTVPRQRLIHVDLETQSYMYTEHERREKTLPSTVRASDLSSCGSAQGSASENDGKTELTT